METAEHREPCESRGSCTDLGAPGGETPPGDSTSTAALIVEPRGNYTSKSGHGSRALARLKWAQQATLHACFGIKEARQTGGQKKSPSAGAGGLRLGLLIFETKTHPVTINTMIDRKLGSANDRGERCELEPIALEVVVVAKDHDDNRKCRTARGFARVVEINCNRAARIFGRSAVQRRVGRMLATSNTKFLPDAQRKSVANPIQICLPDKP